MGTIDKVRRLLFEDGAVLECVENTYQPALNGSRRKVTKAGRGVAVTVLLDDVEREGREPLRAGTRFRQELPKRAGDVLALDGVSVTYRLGDAPRLDGHTVTLRRLCPDCGEATMALYDDGSSLCGGCVLARH